MENGIFGRLITRIFYQWNLHYQVFTLTLKNYFATTTIPLVRTIPLNYFFYLK